MSFHCHSCGNPNCLFCPLGTYVPEDDMRGCTRRLDDVEYAQYQHLDQEVLPFERRPQNVLECLGRMEEKFYHRPIGSLLDSRGKKVTGRKVQERIDAFNDSIQ